MKLPAVHNSEAPGGFQYTVNWASADPLGLKKPKWGLIYYCPCGCGTRGELRFGGNSSPSYLWDQNEDAPTLVPDIQHVVNGVIHWHGYLQDGVWIGESYGPPEAP